jgi:hypothetical protein
MGILGYFFDYSPNTFLDKTPRDILNMTSNKVKDNFDEKYKDNEEYKQLSDNKKEAIFLLRVLKKGLKQEDKDRVLSICMIDKEEQPRQTEPNPVPSMQPRHSAIKQKSHSERPIMTKNQPPAIVEGSAEIDGSAKIEMEGGKYKKTRRRRNKRKGYKKSKRHLSKKNIRH